ncbi:hypothetical protein BH11BAC4_BH11BAC4_11980 [soil metagenome]
MTRALIIDDEIDICYLLSSILRSKNLQVSYVNSLSEASAVLDKVKPSMIFLDNHLPDGLGIDFISEIKKTNPGINVVMITALDNFSERAKAFSNGAAMFITKPFSRDSINEAVDRLMSAS